MPATPHMNVIYLDHNATTPVDPEVAKGMEPWLAGAYGNPSSAHLLGQWAHAAVDVAREQVARLVGCSPRELVFTSCGSEAVATALLQSRNRGRDRILLSSVEHTCVRQTAEALGLELTWIPVDSQGQLDLEAAHRLLDERVALVAVMHANSETGNIYPIEAMGQMAHQVGALLFVDAVQALGKIPLDMEQLPVDLAAFSGHKLYGPKGIGALYVRQGLKLLPLIPGSQERGRRGGTEPVPGIVGFGLAAYRALASQKGWSEKVRNLRDQLEEGLHERIPGVRMMARSVQRIPNTCLAMFPGHYGPDLVLRLSQEGICVSTGSACAGNRGGSLVLAAMGCSPEEANSALRFSLGKDNTSEHIEQLLSVLSRLVSLR